jgi:hypothetical protein
MSSRSKRTVLRHPCGRSRAGFPRAGGALGLAPEHFVVFGAAPGAHAAGDQSSAIWRSDVSGVRNCATPCSRSPTAARNRQPAPRASRRTCRRARGARPPRAPEEMRRRPRRSADGTSIGGNTPMSTAGATRRRPQHARFRARHVASVTGAAASSMQRLPFTREPGDRRKPGLADVEGVAMKARLPVACALQHQERDPCQRCAVWRATAPRFGTRTDQGAARSRAESVAHAMAHLIVSAAVLTSLLTVEFPGAAVEAPLSARPDARPLLATRRRALRGQD